MGVSSIREELIYHIIQIWFILETFFFYFWTAQTNKNVFFIDAVCAWPEVSQQSINVVAHGGMILVSSYISLLNVCDKVAANLMIFQSASAVLSGHDNKNVF